MELEPNLLDWNVNELERKLELEDMKHTYSCLQGSENDKKRSLGLFNRSCDFQELL